MEMTAIRLLKAPDDDLPYSFDFSLFDVMESDTMASATVASTPSGLTIGSPSVSGDTVTVRISAGTDGTTYRLKVQGTTTGGYDIVCYADLYVDVPA